jgi:acyl-CoA synthetase (AMP-forming)/AMP-acid ligase II
MTDSNVIHLLKKVAADHPDRPALIMPGGEAIPFGELWRRIDSVSTGLADRGLKPGDRVICMVPMSIDLYTVLLGVLKLGAAAVFIDPWIGLRQIATFAAFAEPAAYIGVTRSHVLRFLDRRLANLPLAVTTGRRILRIPARFTLAELERTQGNGAVHPSACADPALITFTSGSGGTPKGANRTHGFLLAQHRALKTSFPSENDDVDMPMFPVFALNNLAQGVTSVVPGMDFRRVANVDGSRILVQMRRHGVSTCTASPPFIDRLCEAADSAGHLRPALRRVLTGGAPVTDRQIEHWRAAMPDTEIDVVYGSTEAEPVAHLDAAQRLAIHRAAAAHAPGFCVGTPVPELRAKIIRLHRGHVTLGPAGWSDWELPAGEPGELVVTGAHVCRDYYANPVATIENKIGDGDAVWHRMGDTGYLDSAGRFWLVGRVHSTIRRAGKFVHAQLVEQVARNMGAEPCAAVGLPDAALGERVVLVVAKPGVDTNALRCALQASGQDVDVILPTHRELPMDPRHNAKVDYNLLRKRLMAETTERQR